MTYQIELKLCYGKSITVLHIAIVLIGEQSILLFSERIQFYITSLQLALVFICSMDGLPLSPQPRSDSRQARFQVSIGPCTWIFDRKCPDEDIKFYLYTRKNRNDRQRIHIEDSWNRSNISSSYFNPNHPAKIIIHGYNSDMFLSPLIQMKDG